MDGAWLTGMAAGSTDVARQLLALLVPVWDVGGMACDTKSPLWPPKEEEDILKVSPLSYRRGN